MEFTLQSVCCGSIASPNSVIEETDKNVDPFGICAICQDWSVFESAPDFELTPDKDVVDDNSIVYNHSIPVTYIPKLTAKERLEAIGKSMGVVTDFDPADISWITDRIGITCKEGAEIAFNSGYIVINVASELPNNGHAKLVVEPGSGMVRWQLDGVADLMHTYFTSTNKEVVVHCAMGMERSVLAVVWYLNKYLRMTIDDAYKLIKDKRPIAVDRRGWIGI